MNNESEKNPDDSEIIEGGQISTFEELSYDPVRHREDTARNLAFVLVFILALSVFAHYGTNIWLRFTGHDQVAEGISKIFDVWLPIISSLASGAVTHYFSKDR